MDSADQERGPILPKEFMRQLRPENYSDTVERGRHELSKSELEYHLSTITARNETHAFELFCRKLCERAICPNLRPPTGPEGGGDGKADTETFPVAQEIANFWYVGDAQASRERWAFAFSAKKTWKKKVREDVQGLIDTGRPYAQIICVTSQFARSKDRGQLQDELHQAHKIPVTVHDRSWIVDQVFEHDWQDLAVTYLGIGKELTDKHRLGPNDYSRERQLADIERSLADPGSFTGMEMQRATETLVAAKLSRQLERDRTEIDGRFARAIRVAQSHGTRRQHIEAVYESIWTAFWWFDDFDYLDHHYAALAELALASYYAIDLELLTNATQLLFNSVVCGHRTAAQVNLVARVNRLLDRLQELAADKTQPNNALEAKVSQLTMQASRALLTRDRAARSNLWPELSQVLEQARGLGEFSAKRLTQLIEVVAPLGEGDPSYAALVDEVAQFVSERVGEAEGAIVLLKRARQLKDHLEIIRILGKAARQLTKKEYRDEQCEALMHLADAYYRVGMLWAARANLLVALATMFIRAEEDSEIPEVGVVPMLLFLASIAMELRNFPEALATLRLARGSAASLPLDDESKHRFKSDFKRKDSVLACQLVGFCADSLETAAALPDVLGRLELFDSRYALFYALGYEHVLHDDGYATEDYDHVRMARLFNSMASQPCADGDLDIFNRAGQPQALATRVLGLRVEIRYEGSNTSVQVAEVVAGAVEALFATTLESKTFPHTEEFVVTIVESDGIERPECEFAEGAYQATLRWPRDLSPATSGRQDDIQSVLVRLAFTVMLATCHVDRSIKDFFENESFIDRLGMIVVTCNSRQRLFGSSVNRIEEFSPMASRRYPPLPDRPPILRIPLAPNADDEEPNGPDVRDHRDIRVRSIIDQRRWTAAKWRGTGFADLGPSAPPVLGLIFEDASAACEIFSDWQARFGQVDESEAVYVSIVRGLSPDHPHHYAVLLTSAPKESDKSKVIGAVVRAKIMEAQTSENLDGFLQHYEVAGAYLLAPLVLEQDRPPNLRAKYGLLKHKLIVKNFDEITSADVEFMLKAPDDDCAHGESVAEPAA